MCKFQMLLMLKLVILLGCCVDSVCNSVYSVHHKFHQSFNTESRITAASSRTRRSFGLSLAFCALFTVSIQRGGVWLTQVLLLLLTVRTV